MLTIFLINEVVHLTATFLIFGIIFRWFRRPSTFKNLFTLKLGLGASAVSILALAVQVILVKMVGKHTPQMGALVYFLTAFAGGFGVVCINRIQKLRQRP